jgi:hypothetical protein
MQHINSEKKDEKAGKRGNSGKTIWRIFIRDQWTERQQKKE